MQYTTTIEEIHKSPWGVVAHPAAKKSSVGRVRPVNHIFQADRGGGIMFGAPS